jgi:NAD(P)-dependent dehydrogenase (short-subunit alcohol dehydrogenase family)
MERAKGVVRTRAHEEVERAFKDIAANEGRVDLLINNVGNYNPQDVTLLDPAVWDATLATNLSGAYYCCFHAIKMMPAGGQIISIGMAGLEGIRANRRGADYYVSKTGLLVLTRALAAGYATRKIRVNMVSPGQLDNSVDLPPRGDWHEVPLGRAGTMMTSVSGGVLARPLRHWRQHRRRGRLPAVISAVPRETQESTSEGSRAGKRSTGFKPSTS